MPINNATYPFDPTGTLSSNKISGEEHIITPVNYKDYNFIVPNLAPFFATSLVISFKNSLGVDVPLTENVDYYLTHWFLSASRACSKPIYGSITLLNNTLTGVLKITYQTLGGDWNIDEDLLAEILADRIHNPRITTWDSVSEMPYAFPVIDHPWDLIDMVGLTEVVDSLDRIRDAILATNQGNVEQHIIDYDNPHQTTAAQVGAYSKQQTDTLLLLKLDKTAQAADSLKLSGKTYNQLADDILSRTIHDSNRLEGKTLQEITDSITNDITSGTVENANKFGGQTPQEFKQEIANAAGDFAKQVIRAKYENSDLTKFENWTPLATITIKEAGAIDYNDITLQFLVFGGEMTGSNEGVGFIVNIMSQTDGTTTSNFYGMNSLINNLTFGFTIDDSDSNGKVIAVLWAKGMSIRNMLAVTSLTSSLVTLIRDDDTTYTVVDEEPVDYIESDFMSVNFATKTEFDNLVDQLTQAFEDLNAP